MIIGIKQLREGNRMGAENIQRGVGLLRMISFMLGEHSLSNRMFFLSQSS